MIDIHTWVIDGVTYYRKLEVTITDCTAPPEGDPPDASVISANLWRTLVGEPEMKEDGTMETFEERESAHITKMGWKLSE